MNLPQNFGPAMLITLFAGLSTAIGGAIAFIVKKDNLKALAEGKCLATEINGEYAIFIELG